MGMTPDLLKVFGIDAEDLGANRNGVLTARQVKALRSYAWSHVSAAAVLVVLLLAILYLVADKPLQWIQYALSGVLVAALAATCAYAFRRARAAKRAGVVECLVGPVTVERNDGWWLTVQGLSFRVPPELYHLDTARPYRVYIAPAAKRVVAIESDLDSG
jgi:hypothetical protein